MAESLERRFSIRSCASGLVKTAVEIFLERFTEERKILRTLQVYGQLLNSDLRPRLQDISAVSASTAARSAMDPSI